MKKDCKALKNLIPLKSRPIEEQQRIRQNGGKKSQEVQRRKRSMQELTKMLLESRAMTPEAKEQVKLLFPEIADDDLTNAMAITAKILLSAITTDSLKEAVRAAEYLRDTSGEKPKLKVSSSDTVRTVFVTKQEKKEVEKHIKEVVNIK